MAYSPISNLPTPPSRQDPANFSGDADSFLGALPTFQTEVNAAGDYIESKAAEVDAGVTAAAASADAAQVAADSSVAAGNATAWVSGATYAEGDSVWSLVNYQTYRATTDHSGETSDPSADATNWAVLGSPKVTQTRDSFTSTAGQTSFTTGGYTPQFLDVYLNGVYLQNGTDYTAANGTDVILTVGAALDDVLQVVAYKAFEVANVTGAANFTVAGTVTTANISDGTDSVATGYVVNGSAKAWVNFNGTGTVAIRDSMNVASITDEGVAKTKASFTSAMSNTEFVMTATASNGGGGAAAALYAPNISAKSTTATGTIFTQSISTGSAIDDPHVSSTIFGDLA
jgi:hypothetical protein